MNKKIIRLIIGLFVSAVFLYFSFRKFDFETLMDTISGASWGWILVSLLVYSSGYIFRSFRWKILLKPVTDIKASQIFPIITSGFFMNNILPARGGEIFRAMVVKYRQKCEFVPVLTSIGLERLSDLLGTILVLLLALQLLPRHIIHFHQFVDTILVVVVLLLVLYLLSDYIRGHVRKLKKFEKVFIFFEQFKQGVASLKSKRSIGLILIYTTIIFSIELLNVSILSHALHLDLTPRESAALVVGIILGVAIPAAPGAVGTFEFFGTQVLIKLGYVKNDALAFVLLLHFFYISAQALMGSSYLVQMLLDKNSKKRGDQELT